MFDLVRSAIHAVLGSNPTTTKPKDQPVHLEGQHLQASGFTSWWYQSPPADCVVECIRATTGENFEVTPKDLHPYFNVANLWWRPARAMKTIN